jgi:nucleotide-binding universal stress UspA family protein
VTILCGTDFSAFAARAVEAAAWWARARATDLRLIHVLDIPGAEEVLAQDADARVTRYFRDEVAKLATQLQAEKQRVSSPGLTVEVEVLPGRPDEVLVADAARIDAELIVVGAVGRRGDKLWRLGSTADHVAQVSLRPVLVVRDESPIRAWARGEGPLRAVVGVDLTPSSDAALRWITTVGATTRVDAKAAYVYWPPDLRERLKAFALALGSGDPRVQERLQSELSERIASVTGGVSMPLRFVGGLGRPADHLAQIAGEEKADLLVIGTRQRTGAARMWHGSVSHDVIVRAPMNVVVVPTSASAT